VARRVLCVWLCARVGLPLVSNLGNVTTLDLSGSSDRPGKKQQTT
jgi:hypothetical protein